MADWRMFVSESRQPKRVNDASASTPFLPDHFRDYRRGQLQHGARRDGGGRTAFVGGRQRQEQDQGEIRQTGRQCRYPGKRGWRRSRNRVKKTQPRRSEIRNGSGQRQRRQSIQSEDG